MPFYSLMKPAGDFTISAVPLSSCFAAFQTKRGPGDALRLYVPKSSGRFAPSSHRDNILRACENDPRCVQFVDSREKAHLELAVQENRVAITVRDRQATQQGRYRLPTMEVTWDKLASFLRNAQDFFRELYRSSSDTEVTANIDVEFYRLQRTESEISEPELWPSGSNLFWDGKIHLGVENGCHYGVKLTNSGPYDLYPSLFYFDNSDLTRIRESLYSNIRTRIRILILFFFNRHILPATVQWTLLLGSPTDEERWNIDHWVRFRGDASLLILALLEHQRWLPQALCFNTPAQRLFCD